MSYLTCFSDASFCDRTRACGWGGWAIRSEWGRGQFYGGPLTRGEANPNEAEMSAALQLLRAIDAHGGLQGATPVMLQMDNLASLAAIEALVPYAIWSGSSEARDVSQRQVRKTFSALERQIGKDIGKLLDRRPVYLRHVKGHQTVDTGRAWVNSQCDTEAKRHMREQRAGSVAPRRPDFKNTENARKWAEVE